jgi:isocitrate dehydrogenase kinase/phosphatase
MWEACPEAIKLKPVYCNILVTFPKFCLKKIAQNLKKEFKTPKRPFCIFKIYGKLFFENKTITLTGKCPISETTFPKI